MVLPLEAFTEELKDNMRQICALNGQDFDQLFAEKRDEVLELPDDDDLQMVF